MSEIESDPLDTLARFIRDRFVRVFKAEDGEPEDKPWGVEFIVGEHDFCCQYHPAQSAAEFYADLLAHYLALLMRQLSPDSGVPCEGPLLDIAAERVRQVEKGWTLQHDDTHTLGEIASAAAYYATNPYDRTGDLVSRLWPWGHAPQESWPQDVGDRRCELVKAGALIVAEIARLDRHRVAGDVGQRGVTSRD